MAVSYRTHAGPHYNEGARFLRSVLEERKLSLAAAGRLAGCSRANFLKYAYGDTKPGRTAAHRILKEFDVPIDFWEKDLPNDEPLTLATPKPPQSASSLTATDDCASTGTDDG
jgi:transcriptional regulator with XRE-family HTH domain